MLERNDFDDGSSDFTRDYPPTLISYNDGRELDYWVVEYTVTPSESTASYTLTIKDYENANETRIKSDISGENSISISCIADSNAGQPFRPYLNISSEDTQQQTFIVKIEVAYFKEYLENSEDANKGDRETLSIYSYERPSEGLVSEVIISQQIPDMKTFDFLESTFKMFNLTAYVEVNGLTSTLVVQPLDDYYKDPSVKTYDITEYVDDDSYTIAAPKPYNEINFK